MELGFVKLCCAAVVQVSSAKASPGNRASKRSAGDLIGTLPVKATAAPGPNSWLGRAMLLDEKSGAKLWLSQTDLWLLSALRFLRHSHRKPWRNRT
jgi:hypothetical protein